MPKSPVQQNIEEAQQQSEAVAINHLPGVGSYNDLKDSMGRFRTQSLFYEERNGKYPAPFTLKEHDHKGRLSMYKIYMEIGDPTEYAQAIYLLGSWTHWKALSSAPWFKAHLDEWRKELKTRIESERWAEMEKTAKENAGTASGLQAAKWIAEHYTNTKRKPTKRGRPSKQELKNKLTEEASNAKELIRDAERLGLPLQ